MQSENAAAPSRHHLAPLLKADEVARILDVSVRGVYRWATCGHLASIRLSDRSVRFRVADVEAFVAAGASGGPHESGRVL